MKPSLKEREGGKEGRVERYFLGETTQCVHIAGKGVGPGKACILGQKGETRREKGFGKLTSFVY